MSTEPKPGTILHVVSGECGSYSDYTVWSVAAYVDRADADTHAKLARDWHAARLQRRDAGTIEPYGTEWSAINDEVNPYDSQPYVQNDVKYGVTILFVHFNPANFAAESATLTDRAREAGFIP